MEDFPEYQPVSSDSLQVLRKPLKDLAEYFKVIRQLKDNPGPPYTCPTCGTAVKKRPVRAFDHKTLEELFGNSTGSRRIAGQGERGKKLYKRALFVEYPLP